MKYFWSLLYNFVIVPLGIIFYHLFSVFSKKMRKGIAGRRKTFREINHLREKYPDNEIILFHSASLGEYEQVKPVVKGIKEQQPDLKTVVSFTSPSGYENASRMTAVDLYIYMPFDKRSTIQRFLRILQPGKIIFVTYELWPNILSVAKERGIETFLISARIRARSKKWRFYIKSYFADLYRSLDNIFTVTNDDKQELLKIINGKSINLQTLGDPRYDQVIQRAEKRDSKNIPQIFDNGFVICCGSVWEQDLNVITGPLKQLIQTNDNIKIIIAPHETDNFHVNRAKAEFDAAGLSTQKYSELQGKCQGPVLIVDKIGVLAELYHQSHLAFVGGSYKKAIHNVMEPAIAGIPVLFGPKYQNSREAQLLVHHQGGFACENSTEFTEKLNELIGSKEKYAVVSKASREVILNNKGAGKRIVEQILKD